MMQGKTWKIGGVVLLGLLLAAILVGPVWERTIRMGISCASAAQRPLTLRA